MPTAFDARPLVTQTVHDIALAHSGRLIGCNVEPAHGNFRVEWDSDRIAQVLSNLVGNALTHGEDSIGARRACSSGVVGWKNDRQRHAAPEQPAGGHIGVTNFPDHSHK